MTTPSTIAVPSNLLQDLLFNAEKLDEGVNSSALTYLDRLGVSRLTYAGAIARISAVNPRGAWATATAYAALDVVSNSGTWYVALDAHTSGGSFAGDQSAHWRVYQGVLASDLASTSDPTKGAALVGFSTSQAYGAGTVGADLNAARPVSRGGTGATSVSGALANLGMIDVAAAITVNAAQTLTGSALGKCVLITDAVSPANYTLTLPAGAAVGSIIMLRVSRSATKLFTIHGNDVVIDGLASRILWSGEVAVLQREASSWTKISGTSRPFAGGIQRLSSQTGIAAATFRQANFTSAFGDLSGLNLAYNAGSGNLLIPRPGNYHIAGCLALNGTGIVGATAQIALVQNANTPAISPNALLTAIIGTAAPRFVGGVSGLFNCAAGDGIGMIGYISAGTSLIFEFAASTIAPTLTYQEVPSW